MGGATSTTMLCILVALSAWVGQTCAESEEEEFCQLPEVGNAMSTDSIYVRPGHVQQGFDELCEDYLVSSEFRTADGTCNHISNYGASIRPVRRLLPADYGNANGAPRTQGRSGQLLPPATHVSRIIHPKLRSSNLFTFLLMEWGQFMDHDITAFPVASEENKNLRCCTSDGHIREFNPESECFPIFLDEDDTRFGVDRKCMEFSRSVAARDKNKKKLYPREQMSSVTSFIDASMVYGSTQQLQNSLRVNNAGDLQAKLRMNEVKNLLPDNGMTGSCRLTNGSNEYCFLAGDGRVNEHPGLMAIHTIYARTHNLIVDGLKSHNATARDEEELFQTARKIVGAIVQNIQYNEWLPIILDRNTRTIFQLMTGSRTSYLPTVDPRMMNAFSTAAFRFGHSLIPDGIRIQKEWMLLRNLFGKPQQLFNNFNAVVQALFSSTSQAFRGDRFFTSQVTEHLFEMEPHSGLDLVALNIQRGRDHGLPSYNHYRKVCGLEVLVTFDDLTWLSTNIRDGYKALYGSVDDIDLFTGMMSEKTLTGAMVGPTLSCVIGLQFHALKFGDRFYFEHSGPQGFTDDQLKNLRQVTMASVLCQMNGINRVQENAFRKQSKNNKLTNCRNFKFVDYKLW
ncbi:hypothetical protein ACOMHN_038917 [Nucella lapillus]